MEYSEYWDVLAYNSFSKPIVYCENCGEEKDEDDLRVVKHIKYGNIKICLDCVNEVF